MEHMEGDIPYPYLPPPTPTPTYPHPPIPLPTPTPTHPYPYLPPPTPTPTTTHSYYPLPPPTPTTNNGLERSQVIGNVQMWSRRWIQTPPPLLPTTPYHHPPLLQIMVLKDANSKTMLNMVLKEVSEVKWLVMYKCGAGAGDGSKQPHP